MKMKSLIDSNSRFVTVEIQQETGEVLKKNISYESYIDSLNESSSRESNIRIGKLPEGFYDGMISYEKSNTFSCVIVIPAGKFPVQYVNTQFILPFPSTVFFFEVENGNVVISRCYMVKDENVNDETRLYHYCYSNVYDNGRICWGTNNLPAVKNLKELDGLVTLFFSAPSNNDLFLPKSMLNGCEQYSGNIRGLYMDLNGKEKFPDEYLKETYLKLGDLLN